MKKTTTDMQFVHYYCKLYNKLRPFLIYLQYSSTPQSKSTLWWFLIEKSNR